MNFKSKIKYQEFKKKLEILDDEAKSLNNANYNSPEEIESKIEDWEKRVTNYLKTNLTPDPDDLIKVFSNYKRDHFVLFQLKKKSYNSDNQEKIEYIKYKFANKIEGFGILLDYISITNKLKNGDQIVLNTIEDKILFVLNKLYDLYGDNYYSVELILTLNEIDFRQDEPLEIAKNLVKRDYAKRESEYIENDLIKISVKGATYIERKNKSKQKKRAKLEQESVDEKIDQVLKKLEKLGYGQEIIFNEINELREDSKNLSKKSFSQLVKGKVVDLALSNLINSDTAKFIYESIVDDKFKLLP